MDDRHFSYNIFRGNSTRELATQIHSTLKAPEGFSKAKGLIKTETGKKPLSDVGNTLANVRRIIKSMPETCKTSETRTICSVSDLKGLPGCSYQQDEVFSDGIDVWNSEFSKMIDFDQSLDPVPNPAEDDYSDIMSIARDVSAAAIHKMVYLWQQCDIPSQSSWQFADVDNTAPLPEPPRPVTDDLLTHVRELPVPDVVPLMPLASF